MAELLELIDTIDKEHKALLQEFNKAHVETEQLQNSKAQLTNAIQIVEDENNTLRVQLGNLKSSIDEERAWCNYLRCLLEEMSKRTLSTKMARKKYEALLRQEYSGFCQKSLQFRRKILKDHPLSGVEMC